MDAIIFDLDDTLFNVEQYVSGAFQEVAEYLSEENEQNKKEIFNKLIRYWEENTSMKKNLFNCFLEEEHLTGSGKMAADIFNHHHPSLKLSTETKEILSYLKERGHLLGIITDGNKERQERKINSLEIRDFFDKILYVQDFGVSKPSEKPYREFVNFLNNKKIGEIMYIGDNPRLDFKGAKAAGMKTIRVLTGEFKDMKSTELVDLEINSLLELKRLIQ